MAERRPCNIVKHEYAGETKFAYDYMMMQAEHEWIAHVDVNELTNDSGHVNAYIADTKIWCERCGAKFVFRGLPAGSYMDRPSVSIDGTELRTPIYAAFKA